MQGVYLSEFNVSTFIDLIKFETGFNDKAIASYLGVSKSLVCGYKKNNRSRRGACRNDVCNQVCPA